MNDQLRTRDAGVSAPGNDGMLLVSPAQMIARINAIQQVKKELMQEGVHFYTLGGNKKIKLADGTEETVPQFSLGKPGAEMLQLAFGFSSEIQSTVIKDDANARFTVTIGEWQKVPGGKDIKVFREQPMVGIYEVSSLCSVYANDGRLLARASGSCNNGESAFRSTPYADAKNPILKRAEKRAFVAAMLIAAGASDLFTQDLEDLEVTPAGQSSHSAKDGGASNAAAKTSSAGWMNDGQKRLVYAKLKGYGFSDDDINAVRDHINAQPTWREGKPMLAKIVDSSEKDARAVVDEWLKAIAAAAKPATEGGDSKGA